MQIAGESFAMAEVSQETLEAHWSKTKNLTIIVLAIWFVFSYLIHWFAGSLNAMSFMGFPLGYYMAAQGSLFIFVVLIFWLARQQEKIDEEFGVAEEE
jgi:putative solute:sodium symporter small subunit